MDLKETNIYFKAYRKLKANIYYDKTDPFLRKEIAEFEAMYLYNKESNPVLANCMSDYSKDVNFFTELDRCMSNAESREKLFKSLNAVENIKVHFLPKSLGDTKQNNKISNVINNTEINIDKLFCLIDLPIITHILGVVWIIKYGYLLDKNLNDGIYGNRLKEDINSDVDKKTNSLSLFKKYYAQYEKWRDNALKEVKHRINSKEDVYLFALDIKNYFHSTNVDFNLIESDILKHLQQSPIDIKMDELKCLTSFIKEVFEKYSSTFFSSDEIRIPVGFLPSSIISNWYLNCFDKKILEKVKPYYYGRYVDDIIIVVPKFHKNACIGCKGNVNYDEFEEYFIKGYNGNAPFKKIFGKSFNDKITLKCTLDKIISYELTSCSDDTKKDTIYKLLNLRESMSEDLNIEISDEQTLKDIIDSYKDDHPELVEILNNLTDNSYLRKINLDISYSLNFCPKKTCEVCSGNHSSRLLVQNKKIRLYEFVHNGSQAVLNNFISEIKKNVSEFNMFPIEDEIENNFEKKVYELKYDDTINKLRSVSDTKINTYELSKYLSKAIYVSSINSKNDFYKTTDKILKTFSSANGITNYRLWENLISYLVINKDFDALDSFIKNIKEAISNISYDNEDNIGFHDEKLTYTE